MASYITRRGATYYYRRRVPEYLSDYEKRKFIKISLSTKDEKEALRKAAIYNDYIEDYWRSLIREAGRSDPEIEYQKAIKLAKSHGFAYLNITDIAKEPLEDIVKRLDAVSKRNSEPEIVSSLLGGSEPPDILLSSCFDKFILLCRDRTVNKSDHKVRKWKTPRLAAINHFISSIGDKSLKDISRSDILEFRRWWMDRIESGDVTASTANKKMMQVKDILHVVSINHEIDIDFDVLFAKVRFKVVEKSRPPFEE